jgi:hypothetical protein
MKLKDFIEMVEKLKTLDPDTPIVLLDEVSREFARKGEHCRIAVREFSYGNSESNPTLILHNTR